jgi:hypothetical protein
MNVVCPLCKGPAVQPIMDIYCKNECQKGKPKGSRDNLEIYQGTVHHVYKGPPSDVYKKSTNLHEWIPIKCTDEDDITRAIDNMGSWSRFKYWKLVIIP